MKNSPFVRAAVLIGITASFAFAQTSSFGQAAQGIALEMITIAKVSGLVLGLIFALFASPIVTWVQAL